MVMTLMIVPWQAALAFEYYLFQHWQL